LSELKVREENSEGTYETIFALHWLTVHEANGSMRFASSLYFYICVKYYIIKL
jgi:hypothetical protein